MDRAALRRLPAVTVVLVLALTLGTGDAGAQPGHDHGAAAAVALQTGVSIIDFAFQPAAITVPIGATVTWRNTGRAPHTVTSDRAGEFDSKTLSPGQTFAFQSGTPGTFPYHCDIHPNMTATVTVQAPSPTAAPSPPPATASPTPPAATATRAPSPVAAASPAATTASPTQAGNAVRIVDFAFEPGTLTVAAGTTVTWTHAGQAPHTATSTAATKVFDSGRLSAGQTFSFTFATPGTYAYRCEVHPARMTGTIEVRAAAATATPAPAAAAATPVPGGEQRGAQGMVTFADRQARVDQVRIEVSQGLQPPQGTTAVAWLLGANNSAQRLGALTPDAAGKATLTYTDAQARNLLGLFDKVVVTAESRADGAQPEGRELLRDEINPGALAHIRHLVSAFDSTPKNTPLAAGMLSQAALAADHANLAKMAVQANNLADARLHLEHIVNIIDGEKGPNFGDLNGDEKRDNPGDGFGLLAYARAAAEHAQLAIDAAPRDETVRLHGGHVMVTTKNVTDWATQARDVALPLFRQQNVAGLRAPVDQIVTLLDGAFKGVDANRDGRIDP
ncbi:MAG: cupredoxin domain-containing protein, partial [Dehalococcoidia bacterium]